MVIKVAGIRITLKKIHNITIGIQRKSAVATGILSMLFLVLQLLHVSLSAERVYKTRGRVILITATIVSTLVGMAVAFGGFVSLARCGGYENFLVLYMCIVTLKSKSESILPVVAFWQEPGLPSQEAEALDTSAWCSL